MTGAWSPHDVENADDAADCRAMWLAVIHQAILDASGRPPALSGHAQGEEAREYFVRTAQVWFGTADFLEVCALAGVEPGWVLAKLPEFGKSRRSARGRGRAVAGQLEGRSRTPPAPGRARNSPVGLETACRR